MVDAMLKRVRSVGQGILVLALGMALLTGTAAAFEEEKPSPPPPKVKQRGSKKAVPLGDKVATQEEKVTIQPERIEAHKAAATEAAKSGLNVEPVAVPTPGQENPDAPVIKVDQGVHNFGTVWTGPVLKHEFTIRNEGKTPLQITKVKPACGCTIAGEYPRSIAPGESGKFPFSIPSDKLRGKFEKAITVTSNDPATPDLQLKLAGECMRYVDVTPATVNFSRVMDKEAKEQKVTVTNNSETPLQLTLTPPQAGSKFTWEMAEKTPGKTFELTIRMNPPFEPGTIRDVVALTTNVEAQKSLQVPITAIVPERLEVQPAEITIGSAIPNRPAATKKQLRFTNHGERPTKVVSAQSPDEKIKVTVTPQTEGKNYTIEVEWPADYAVPPAGQTIALTTDDPDKPIINIPVKSAVRTADKTQGDPGDRLIGKPAPAFSVTTLEGKPVSNDSLKGSVAVLNFFAPNCGFCKKQMPRLEPLRTEYGDKGVRFINVSQTMKKEFPNEEIVKIVKDIGVNAELAIDSKNTAGPPFMATSFPTMIVVGKTGNVEVINRGNIGDLESRLRGQLDALIAGKPIPQELIAKATPTPKPEAPKPPPAQELVGKPAPEFSLKTMEGKSLATADLANTSATVLDFVAPNCGFCKKQLPRIEAIKADYVAKGVRFVNVTQKMGQKEFTPEEVADVYKSAGSTNEIAPDPENKVGSMFRAQGFPTMVIVGKSGKVEAVNVGNVADLETRLKGQLDAIIAGKPVPTFEAPVAAVPSPLDKAAAAAPPKRPALELVGKPAPEFSITTLEGKVASHSDFANHPATVLNFVAPNCGFCKKQLPTVEAIRKEYEAKGVRFVNVSQKMGQKEFTTDEVVATYKGAGSQLELATDTENKVGHAFKAQSYPTMVVVGKDGKIAHVNIGAAADLDSKLKGQLDSLISGKPLAAEAQVVPVPVPVAAPKP